MITWGSDAPGDSNHPVLNARSPGRLAGARAGGFEPPTAGERDTRWRRLRDDVLGGFANHSLRLCLPRWAVDDCDPQGASGVGFGVKRLRSDQLPSAERVESVADRLGRFNWYSDGRSKEYPRLPGSIVGPRIPTALSVGFVDAYVGSIGPDSFHTP